MALVRRKKLTPRKNVDPETHSLKTHGPRRALPRRALRGGAAAANRSCFASSSSSSSVSSSRNHSSSSSSSVSASASAEAATASFAPPPPRDTVITSHPSCNVPDSVYDKMGSNLHRRPDHPICIIKEAIYEYFDSLEAAAGTSQFKKFDDLPCVVPATSNFDAVLVPADHVSRSPNDTYYVDDATVLRCHTSAHQLDTLRAGEKAFLVTGDVYRRDSIDASHYPVFHQMEGVRVFEPAEFSSSGSSGSGSGDDTVAAGTAHAERELKRVLEGLARHLFGSEAETRWVDAFFPFTEPSFELEVLFRGEWLEVLGCGVMQREILRNAGADAAAERDGGGPRAAWAFGLGLERLAMVLFGIPDIRLFWSGTGGSCRSSGPGTSARGSSRSPSTRRASRTCRSGSLGRGARRGPRPPARPRPRAAGRSRRTTSARRSAASRATSSSPSRSSTPSRTPRRAATRRATGSRTGRWSGL